MATKNNRLLSLDIMRGITIAGMILVNNSGSWAPGYAPLRHAEWNGLTPTDLVFPFFMFIMGVSTYLSLRGRNFEWSWPTVAKIVRRAVVIYLIGIGLAWLGTVMRGTLVQGQSVWEAANCFGDIRILGVLPRLAICYGIGALLAITLRHKWLPWVIGTLLVGYAILLIVGDGYEFTQDNIIGRIDRAVLGENHMYHMSVGETRLAFDPEGLISTLPSIAHVMIGFMCGAMIVKAHTNADKALKLFVIGTALTAAGLLLSWGMPINKRLWSPTFVLTTCGMAASLLGLLIWICDIKGKVQWGTFFKAFGVNPLYLYVQSVVLYYLVSYIMVPCSAAPGGTASLKAALYYCVLAPASCHNDQLASLMWGILFVIINWIPGYWLMKRKVYIKI